MYVTHVILSTNMSVAYNPDLRNTPSTVLSDLIIAQNTSNHTYLESTQQNTIIVFL